MAFLHKNTIKKFIAKFFSNRESFKSQPISVINPLQSISIKQLPLYVDGWPWEKRL